MMSLDEARTSQARQVASFSLGARAMREEILALLATAPSIEALEEKIDTHWNSKWGEDHGHLGGTVSFLTYDGVGVERLIENNGSGQHDATIATAIEKVADPVCLVLRL